MLSVEESFEHAACGLVTAETDGTIVRVNSTFCRWLGYEPSQLMGVRKVSDFLTIGGKLFHQTHWGPLLEMQRSVAELKLEIVGRARNRIPMLLNVRRIRIEAKEYDHFAFMVLEDRQKFEQELLQARTNAERALKAQREAERELRRAARQKDEFLATLAHELRNPLAPMRSVVDLLQRKSSLGEREEWAYGVLDRQLGQISHLVDDLLEIARFNEGKIELRRVQLNLADAMRTALEGSEPRINAASHRLSISLPSEPLIVDADPTRLSQIMQNLLNNAAKYTPPGGDIWFSGLRADNEAVIVVRDSGIGIDAADLPAMFGMFAQLPGGKAFSQGGLGVGLALVKMLVTLHGGAVSAHSDGAGQGSEFVVRLPLSTSKFPPVDAPAPAPVEGASSRRIILVDDNRDALESLGLLLELEGHTVWRAHDGASALRIAQENELDVALLDIGLPDMSGYEPAAQLRAAEVGSRLLLIALTGWGQEEDRQKAKIAGFKHHFTKPIDLEQLRAAMRAQMPMS